MTAAPLKEHHGRREGVLSERKWREEEERRGEEAGGGVREGRRRWRETEKEELSAAAKPSVPPSTQCEILSMWRTLP